MNMLRRRMMMGQGDEDYSRQYLTFEYEPKSNNIFISGSQGCSVYVSFDLGATWLDWSQIYSDYYLYDVATNNPSHKILLKGTDGGYSSMLWIGDLNDYSSLPQKIYGNILSLCYGDNFIGQTTIPTGHNFMYAFGYKPGLYDASNLILPPMVTEQCYLGMFTNDTGLVAHPQLPATTLASQCYRSMFSGCTSLNYIKCLATDISATNCLQDWVNGVAATGTFVKATGVSWPTGYSGIPSGWTVQDA